MRHYPEFRAADARLKRLFELLRQRNVQTLLRDAGEVSDTLRPDVALALRERANRSLRTVEPYNSSVR
ncbi:hypothetical protein [Marivita sp.]|uniref:hypothetical protein n=1 Tax=Marivita sp. TaxID=2003365 RepID=UPI003F6EA815